MILFAFLSYSCSRDIEDKSICDADALSRLFNEPASAIPNPYEFCKIAMGGTYWQGVTSSDSAIFASHHNSGRYPNLKLKKISLNGNVLSRSFSSLPIKGFNLNEWNISDWYYDNSDSTIYAVMGKTTVPRNTKIITFDPNSFDFLKEVYQTNRIDSNYLFYGEGIVKKNDEWWIAYEAYSSNQKEVIDIFDLEWKQRRRITLENFKNLLPDYAVNHIQGIAFVNDELWCTIHPQLPGWTYQGEILRCKIINNTGTVIGKIVLSTLSNEAIGQGIATRGNILLLNGLHDNIIALNL